MSKYMLNRCLWALVLFVASCVSDNKETPLGEFEKGVLIINEGAFGSNDGEIYHYDPEAGEMKSDIFEAKNSRPFAGLIQSLVLSGGRVYLVANTGKVEIVDAKDFSSKGAVNSGLDISRSIAVAAQKLFISDWGPYDENYSNPSSYLAVVRDIDGGSIDKKITISSRPEDLFVQSGNVLVACSSAKSINVISAEDEEVIESIFVEGNPFQFFEQGGKLYLYARDASQIYFHEISRSNFTVLNTVSIPLSGAGLSVAVGEGNDIYVLTSTGWPNYNDALAKVSLTSGQVLDAELYVGSGFYGLGFHSSSKQIYLGDNNGFQGNGSVMILDQSGQLLKTLDVGRGPSGFKFR